MCENFFRKKVPSKEAFFSINVLKEREIHDLDFKISCRNQEDTKPAFTSRLTTDMQMKCRGSLFTMG